MRASSNEGARNMPDWDDPQVEQKWCEERRTEVAAYLEREKVKHGRIGEWHSGQREGGWMIDSFLGIRHISTLRKEPMTSPNDATMI